MNNLKLKIDDVLFTQSKYHSGVPTPKASPRTPSAEKENRILTNRLHVFSQMPTCIVMCGLPARGKSYIVRLLKRYLLWQGFECKIFNVGDYRRKAVKCDQSFEFFDHSNEQGNLIRQKLAMTAFQDVLNYLLSGSSYQRSLRIAIFDATNTTRARRDALIQHAKGVELLFIESVCTDPVILERNYQMKLNSPDYRDMDPVVAREDFMKRVKEYEEVYEPLNQESDKKLTYIRLFNVGEHMELNRVHGYLPMEIVTYLGNIHIQPRKIYLLRHGETVNDVKGILSGDSKLTPTGIVYSHEAAQYVLTESLKKVVEEKQESKSNKLKQNKILVYTSTLQASIQTGGYFNEIPNTSIIKTRLLNELGGGKCEGLTYQEIEKKYHSVSEERKKNKLIFRYPGAGGESYLDVIERLKPIILELERSRDDVVVISHNAVLRVILGYFIGAEIKEIPNIEILKNTVILLEPGPFGVNRKHVEIEIPEDEVIKLTS